MKKRDSDHSLVLVLGEMTDVCRAVIRRIVGSGRRVVALQLACTEGTSTAAIVAGALSGENEVVACAATDDAIECAVRRAVETYGAAGAGVFVASDAPAGGVRDTDATAMHRGMHRNVELARAFVGGVADQMVLAGGPGSIVLVADSLNDGNTPARDLTLTGDTSWGALARMTKTLAADLGPFGIRVNAVRGQTKAPHRRLPPIPLGRLATPDEVAAVAAFLAGTEASFMTGAVVPVDGGLEVIR